MSLFDLESLQETDVFDLIRSKDMDYLDFSEWIELKFGEKIVTQQLIWKDLDGVEHTFEGTEDQVEVFVGKLMDSFWNPKDGWTIEWTTKTLSIQYEHQDRY